MGDGTVQRSEVRGQKGAGVAYHASQHSAYFPTRGSQFGMLFHGQVTAVFCEIERRVSFTIFSIAIS
jgi:hypothetical protein